MERLADASFGPISTGINQRQERYLKYSSPKTIDQIAPELNTDELRVLVDQVKRQLETHQKYSLKLSIP